MSKLRYGWWSYVKDMIRRYPELSEEYFDLHKMKMISNYSGIQADGFERTIERVAVRQLSTTKQREFEAVHRAIETIKKSQNAKSVLYIIKLVYWERRYTLEGAAMLVPCSIATAKRYHGDFIRLVASYYGLLD